MKADAQVLKGHLDALLLASLEEGPRRGYAVKEALRAGSDARFDLPTGTIYPALRLVLSLESQACEPEITNGRSVRKVETELCSVR